MFFKIASVNNERNHNSEMSPPCSNIICGSKVWIGNHENREQASICIFALASEPYHRTLSKQLQVTKICNSPGICDGVVTFDDLKNVIENTSKRLTPTRPFFSECKYLFSLPIPTPPTHHHVPFTSPFPLHPRPFSFQRPNIQQKIIQKQKEWTLFRKQQLKKKQLLSLHKNHTASPPPVKSAPFVSPSRSRLGMGGVEQNPEVRTM